MRPEDASFCGNGLGADGDAASAGLGFQIDTYMPPEKVQKEYFSGRADGMRAFENVCLISASYTAGYDYE